MRKGSETILLVDDHDGLREVTRRQLAKAGYRVVEAAGPQEAVDLCARPDFAFDLLLTDLHMPGMSGMELAARIRAERPSTLVVLMSGEKIAGADETWLLKPFSSDDLYRELRGLLDAR